MRRLRMGMIGGGHGALAGNLHRHAIAAAGDIDFVAGSLASTPERALDAARELQLSRPYASWEALLETERKLPRNDRLDFVAIVTPNHLHHTIAAAFLEAGFDVVCDKPITSTLADAKALVRLVDEKKAVFALTHNYSGFPMVKQARHMVAAGEIGEVTRVIVEYLQGWLVDDLEKRGHAGAAWRTDPARSGRGGALADIGTHAEHLVRYVTGLQPESVCADLGRTHGRKLDDDACVLLRLSGEARGVLTVSQVRQGEANGLTLRVYGTKGALEWDQENPDVLLVRRNDAPLAIYRRGERYLCDAARRSSRLPAGHLEGFFEAFANVYRNAADTIRARREHRAPSALEHDFPTAADGLRGIAFVEACVVSNASEKKWTALASFLN